MSGTWIGSRSKWRQVNVLESFGIQESQEALQGLCLIPEVQQSTQLYSGERSLSGRLVQSLESGFTIHLRIGLSEEEGDAFLGALGVDKMEEAPVVEMEGDMEVVDAEFECRD